MAWCDDVTVVLLICLVVLLPHSYAFKVGGRLSREQLTCMSLLSNTRDDLNMTKIIVGGSRVAYPGDYLVHRNYGVGRYKGLRYVDITPSRQYAQMEPVVVVKYLEAEITWYEKIAPKELFWYRSSASGGNQSLSSILDRRKWKRLIQKVERQGESMALDLAKTMAVRNCFRRPPFKVDPAAYEAFEKSFEHKPTSDQLQCFQSIEDDMAHSTRPMDRLVCGDVGFGKTEVAMRAIYRAVLSKKQVAVLVPTRVLAAQHGRVIQKRMPDVKVDLLKGGGDKDAVRVKESIRRGDSQVVVGTHALLQDSVSFKNLGLVVVDEEQKFGVTQKEKLRTTNRGVDLLTLSATPIPRTLRLSLSGMRDISQMNTPPQGRKEVKVFTGVWRDALVETAIKEEIRRGGQVFVVVPFVQEVLPMKERLSKLIPGLRCIEAHGRHKQNIENDDVYDGDLLLEERIDAFEAKKADVLIATTVIENGIDIPNANTIVVYQADRFGMSNLYQLRGRVGRSERQAYALFLTNSTQLTADAENRLQYLRSLTALGSGYELAMRDMEMRGSGTLLGSEQSGSGDIGLDLQAEILQQARKQIEAECILPVSETRLDLGTSLERFGTKILGRKMPENANDLIEVGLWESDLARAVIESTSRLLGIQSGQQEAASDSDAGISSRGNSGNNVEKAKSAAKIRKAKNSHSDGRDDFDSIDKSEPSTSSVPLDQSDTFQEFDFAYNATTALQLAMSSKEDLDSLETSWEALFDPIPPPVSELLLRARLRVACRDLAVLDVSLCHGDGGSCYDLLSPSIDYFKWESIKAAVPERYRTCVDFQMLSANEVRGRLYLDASSSSAKSSNGGVGLVRFSTTAPTLSLVDLLVVVEAISDAAKSRLQHMLRPSAVGLAGEIEEAAEKQQQESAALSKLAVSKRTSAKRTKKL